MVWVINFPSYYSDNLFRPYPYCLIDSAPIECLQDPSTPYQMLIRNSPKIVEAEQVYRLTVMGIQCPKALYLQGRYPLRYLFFGILPDQAADSFAESALLVP